MQITTGNVEGHDPRPEFAHSLFGKLFDDQG
ncbi:MULTISPECIES: hypothetical protein [Nitrosomonas]